MAREFDPDYSESEDAVPLVHALGLISIDWNMTEQFMTALIWNYVGGHEIGMSVTNNIGNRSKADMLLELAKKFEKDKHVLKNIEHTVKAFNVLRDNRNMLMHSHTVDKNKTGNCEWRRQNPKAPLGSVGMIADLKDLYEVRDDICMLGKHITELYILTMPNRKGKSGESSLDLFKTPRRLKQVK